MQAVIEFLKSSINLIIVASFISLMFMIALIAQRANNPDENGLSEYMQYSDKVTSSNNNIVTGNFVKRTCNSYEMNGSCSIVVYTKRYNNGFYIFDQISNIDSDYYINPASDFYVSTLHDTDMQVVQIRFIERGIDSIGNLVVPIGLSDKFLNSTNILNSKIDDLENASYNTVVSRNLNKIYNNFVYVSELNEILKWSTIN